MVKKLFALASVTALTGLMAAVAASGCSSSTVVDATPVTEAGPDAKVTPKEAGKDPDPEETGAGTCPTTTPVTEADIGLTWVAPGPVQDACTQDNLDALKAVFAKGKGSASYKDIEASLGANCAACAFTPVKGTRWGVIIKDGANVAADNSSGSCFGQLSTPECGKAVFELDACIDIACPQADCPDRAACTPKAVKGACKSFAGPFQKACTDPTVPESCNNFVKTIVVSCGGGADGGKDSGL